MPVGTLMEMIRLISMVSCRKEGEIGCYFRQDSNGNFSEKTTFEFTAGI